MDNNIALDNTNIQYMTTATTRAEIDIQVATAHQYPRSVQLSTQNALAIATMDKETAGQCFYRLKRGDTIIEGPSIRLAEIIGSCWGNLRIKSEIKANDGQFVTVVGICHDLETNVAISQEVSRSIKDSKGRTYSADMQVMTTNAASSIAIRNAINRVVPKAITKNIMAKCKEKFLANVTDPRLDFQNAANWFAKLSVSVEQLLEYLGVQSIDQITAEHVANLHGLANAINDKQTTIQEVFPPKQDAKPTAQDAVARAKEIAAKKAQSAPVQPNLQFDQENKQQ